MHLGRCALIWSTPTSVGVHLDTEGTIVPSIWTLAPGSHVRITGFVLLIKLRPIISNVRVLRGIWVSSSFIQSFFDSIPP